MTSWCPENSAKRGRGQGRREQAALNIGFRRYDGVRCGVRTRHAGSLPRRGTRPEFEGGWRAEKRKILMARALRHAGAFRRANHGGCGTGPCFRPVRRAANAPTDPSASSWQGLLVVPEGAPLPPECLVATDTQAPHLRPALKTPLERAPQLDEVRAA